MAADGSPGRKLGVSFANRDRAPQGDRNAPSAKTSAAGFAGSINILRLKKRRFGTIAQARATSICASCG